MTDMTDCSVKMVVEEEGRGGGAGKNEWKYYSLGRGKKGREVMCEGLLFCVMVMEEQERNEEKKSS